MKAQPIPFTDEMVRALRDGRKSQTRRVVKPQPLGKVMRPMADGWGFDPITPAIDRHGVDRWHCPIHCPYGRPGDLLWCKETWAISRGASDEKRDIWRHQGWSLWYRADGSRVFTGSEDGGPAFMERGSWRSSRFMFRWASRITLHLTDVRVERVQEIGEEDARTEGALPAHPPARAYGGQPAPNHLLGFQRLWDSINKDKGYGWTENPWVWVLAFRVIHANVDDVMRNPAGYGLESAA